MPGRARMPGRRLPSARIPPAARRYSPSGDRVVRQGIGGVSVILRRSPVARRRSTHRALANPKLRDALGGALQTGRRQSIPSHASRVAPESAELCRPPATATGNGHGRGHCSRARTPVRPSQNGNSRRPSPADHGRERHRARPAVAVQPLPSAIDIPGGVDEVRLGGQRTSCPEDGSRHGNDRMLFGFVMLVPGFLCGRFPHAGRPALLVDVTAAASWGDLHHGKVRPSSRGSSAFCSR